MTSGSITSRVDGPAPTIATPLFSSRSRSASSLAASKIAAFGSTRRAGVRAAQDRNLQLMLKADTPVATVVGKTWDLHVREALRIPLEENFEILSDTISFLKKHVDEVIFDAEHFFDGYYTIANTR